MDGFDAFYDSVTRDLGEPGTLAFGERLKDNLRRAYRALSPSSPAATMSMMRLHGAAMEAVGRLRGFGDLDAANRLEREAASALSDLAPSTAPCSHPSHFVGPAPSDEACRAHAPSAARDDTDDDTIFNERVVCGTRVERTLADFVNACEVTIEEINADPNGQTHMVALLCDAVRLAREYVAHAKSNPIVIPTPSVAARPASEDKTKDGAALIAAERARQVSAEGWTPEHDDHHKHGELVIEAARLAVLPTDVALSDERDGPADPWGLVRKHRKDRERALVIAGALIAAEIDRLQRAALRSAAATTKEGGVK